MIKVCISGVRFPHKPQEYEIPLIVENMITRNITVELLAKAMINGFSMRGQIGKTKEEDWEEQQVFAVDVDDGITIEDAIQKYKYLRPAFIYTTFSHSEKLHKFRIVFISDEIITDFKKAKEIQLKLVQIIEECDKLCKNINRPYFGGKEIAYESYSNRLPIDILDEVELLKSSTSNGRNATESVMDKTDSAYIDYSRNCNIEAIKKLDSDTLRTLINLEKFDLVMKNTILYTEESEVNIIFNDELKQVVENIEMGDYLGIDKYNSFLCLFHDDHKPSASIKRKYHRIWIYDCYSKCEISEGIIKVTQRIAGCNRQEAKEFICNVYNIHVI